MSELDLKQIKALANLLSETDLSEIEVEIKDMRIRLARKEKDGVAAITTSVVNPQQRTEVAKSTENPPQKTVPEQGSSTNKPGTQLSPMVGTAYLAPEPGASAFVNVGSKVKEGQTLMIIEAMKTMNDIPAERQGTVTAILVENGQPVEFGEPLVVIE